MIAHLKYDNYINSIKYRTPARNVPSLDVTGTGATYIPSRGLTNLSTPYLLVPVLHIGVVTLA